MTAYDVSEGGTHAPRFAMTQFTVEEFFGFWPQLEEMLDSVPHTWRHWTKEYICQKVADNTMQVWGIGPPPRAVLIVFTTVNVFPTMKVLAVVWAAGSFTDDMLPLFEATFDNYARLNGCEEIEVRGRLGWEVKLRTVGFTRESAVWSRRVPNATLN